MLTGLGLSANKVLTKRPGVPVAWVGYGNAGVEEKTQGEGVSQALSVAEGQKLDLDLV